MIHQQPGDHPSVPGLRDILLSYLMGSGSVGNWPGADGLTVDDILDAYPEAAATGKVPDWREIIHRHPDVETELADWLAAKDRWKFAFRRLHPPG